MPTYDFKNKETGEVIEKILSFSQRDEFLASGEWEHIHLGAAKTVTHTGNIINTTSGDWKDLLGNIKKHAGEANTIKI